MEKKERVGGREQEKKVRGDEKKALQIEVDRDLTEYCKEIRLPS